MVAGFFAGIVNTVAGGGSFLTLPALMLFGLDPKTANATNRIALLCSTRGGCNLSQARRFESVAHVPIGDPDSARSSVGSVAGD